jgi:hypothetical protein
MNPARLSLATSVLLFCFSALAIEPIGADGSVLGVPHGVYSGSGQLLSQSMIVPDLDFVSRRKINAGVIIAKTTAQFYGAALATASAKLRVIVHPDGRTFQLVDDKTSQPAGSGRCSDTSCTFTARVMNGELELTETWRPTSDGFEVINASQVFKGLPASYSSSFVRSR